jgi:hypothetical protein
MVQISTRVLVAALAAAPALAIPLSQPVEASVSARDVNDVELDARNPFLGKIFKKAAGFLGFGRDLEDLETREFADELLDFEARDFDDNMELDAREFEEVVSDLEARNPFLGKIFKKAAGFLGFGRNFDDEIDARAFEEELLEAREEMTELDARELAEFVGDLEARNPFLGKIFKKAAGFLGFGRDLEAELDAREFDEAVNELEARNPFLGKIFKKAAGFLGFGRDVSNEIDARDLEDELLEAREQLTELDAREFDEFVGDLEARNPFLGKIFKKAAGFLGFGRDFEDSEFEARDFDVEEVDARDFFDYEDFEAREIDELD